MAPPNTAPAAAAKAAPAKAAPAPAAAKPAAAAPAAAVAAEDDPRLNAAKVADPVDEQSAQVEEAAAGTDDALDQAEQQDPALAAAALAAAGDANKDAPKTPAYSQPKPPPNPTSPMAAYPDSVGVLVVAPKAFKLQHDNKIIEFSAGVQNCPQELLDIQYVKDNGVKPYKA